MLNLFMSYHAKTEVPYIFMILHQKYMPNAWKRGKQRLCPCVVMTKKTSIYAMKIWVNNRLQEHNI